MMADASVMASRPADPPPIAACDFRIDADAGSPPHDTGPATKVLRRNNGTSAAEKRRRGERGPVDSASAVTAELRTSNEAGR